MKKIFWVLCVVYLIVVGLLYVGMKEVRARRLSMVGVDIALRGPVEYDIGSYGAIGDGVNNDVVAIQAAISACGAAGGGVVRIPAGTYLCNSGVNLDGSSSVEIRGSGRNTVILFTNAGDGFVTTDAGAILSISMSDLTIGTTNAAAGAAIYANQTSTSGSTWKLERLFIGVSGAGRWDYGIRLSNIQSSIMRDIVCYSGEAACDTTWMLFSATSNAWDVSGLLIGGFYDLGIYIYNSRQIAISGSTIQGQANDTLVKLHYSTTFSTVTVTGSHLENVDPVGNALKIFNCDYANITGSALASGTDPGVSIGAAVGRASAVGIENCSINRDLALNAKSFNCRIAHNFFTPGKEVTPDDGVDNLHYANTDTYTGGRLPDVIAIVDGVAAHSWASGSVSYAAGVDVTINDLTLPGGLIMNSYAPAKDTSLVLSLPLCEGAGSIVYDYSQYGHDGTIYGIPVWGTGDFGDVAITFDGVDDRISVADTADLRFGTGDFSIEFWIYASTDGVQTQYVLGMNHDNQPNEWCVFYNSVWQQVYFQSQELTSPVDAWLNAKCLLTQDTWNHCVITRTGRNIKYYTNGSQDSDEDDWLSVGADFSDTGWKGIGRGTYVGGWLNQELRGVRLYKRELSYPEVRAHYLRENAIQNVTMSDRHRWVGTDGAVDMSLINGTLSIPSLKTGTTQVGAGAAVGEAWVDTDDDFTIKLGQ